MIRTGTWWGSREWSMGPVRVHLLRVPRAGSRWAYRAAVTVGRVHVLATWEPKP